MATLSARLLALEKSTNTAPMMVLHVDGEPTPEQWATIDHCTRTGQRVFVHCSRTSLGWAPGCGVVAPWEIFGANH